jgi:hypothetical protein
LAGVVLGDLTGACVDRAARPGRGRVQDTSGASKDADERG